MDSLNCLDAETELLRDAPLPLRLDLGPWFIVHSVLFWLYMSGLSAGPYSFVHALAVFFAVLGHVLTSLAQHWSVHAWRHIRFSKVSTVKDATHIYVRPMSNDRSSGAVAAVVPMEKVDGGSSQSSARPLSASVNPSSDRAALVSLPEYRFQWRSMFYEVRPTQAAGQWQATPVSDHLPTARPLGEYAAWAGSGKGWGSTDSATLSRRFGPNVVPVPLPSFGALFLEHATAPFFVFQVACVGLWCLDEYVWYSLFTLGTLVAMEATLVGQRIATAKQLRGMRPPPHPVFVFRGGQWRALPSQDLLPWDIISIAREPAPSPGAGPSSHAAGSGGLPCPADVLLLAGSCVANEAMLTGESTPQVKEAPGQATGDTREVLDAFTEGSDRVHARHVVFSGTAILTASCDGEGTDNRGSLGSLPIPPDRGAVAVVLRTGPHTAQGELLRSILHATSRVSVADKEAFLFIAGMLVFAIAAAWYVLTAGLADPRRDRWKLGLHVIMILTTVVPPELPVELSMAVNMSLTGLIRKGIYCTEPNRIPLAGKVDTVAFDKTGTLTADSFRVQGVALLKEAGGKAVVVQGTAGLPPATRLVLLGCHDLVEVRVQVPAPKPKPGQAAQPGQAPQWRVEYAGDPIERAALEALGWSVDGKGTARPKTVASPGQGGLLDVILQTGPSVRVLHRWAFSSALKRMSAVVQVHGSVADPRAEGPSCAGSSAEEARAAMAGLQLPGLAASHFVIVTKGAPEVVQDLLAVVPEGYARTHARLSAAGARVLALAFRVVKTAPDSGWARMSRDDAEARGSLIFAGFLSVSSPLKTDSARVIRELQDSGHRVLMITGDAPLTALAVAGQLGMGSGQAKGLGMVLDTDQDAALVLQTAGQEQGEARKPSTIASLLALVPSGTQLAVTGRAMDQVRRQWGADALSSLCLHAGVFARVSPSQKEAIICAINAAPGPGNSKRHTAMVGDGSNDTGALKASHLGLAVLSNPDLEARYDRARLEAAAKRRQAGAGPQAGQAPGRPGPAGLVQGDPGLEEDEGEVEALLKGEQERTAAMLSEYSEGVDPSKDGPSLTSQLMQSAMAGQGANHPKRAELEALQARLAVMEAEAEAEGAMAGPPVVSLGDASMAAPLTSKLPTPASILEVLRQGRCTLVTTHQMFKILGVNALVAAYMMSVLHLADVKLGDSQATVTAMGAAMCFFLLSWAKPIRRLSKERPHGSVFHPGLVLSVLGQFAVHTAALLLASALVGHNPWDVAAPAPEDMVGWNGTHVAGDNGSSNSGAAGLAGSEEWTAVGQDLLAAKLFGADGQLQDAVAQASSGSWFGWGDDPAPSAPSPSSFKPSHVNTAVFLVYAAAQACTFLVSYHGPPFMEPLAQQKGLVRACGLLYVVCVLGALGFVPELNSWLQLLPLESRTQRLQLAVLILADGALCWAVEAGARAVDRMWSAT